MPRKIENRSQVYSAASAALREKYSEEFRQLCVSIAEANGLEYNLQPTKEEKARAQFEKLLAEFPGLAEQIK